MQSGKRTANVTQASRWPLGPGQRGTVEPQSIAVPNRPRWARIVLCAGLPTPHLDDRRSPAIRGRPAVGC